MAIRALTKADISPIAKNGISELVRLGSVLSKSYPVAANITGTAAKKEYSTAVSRLMLDSIPPMIVDPDRDTPGKRART